MSVKIIDPKPQGEVLKRVVCPHCGALLEYVPNDVSSRQTKRDYLGDYEMFFGIDCPNCSKVITIK